MSRERAKLPKLGDHLVINRHSKRYEGQRVTVWDLDEVSKIVMVNFVQGPKHDMVKLGFNLAGPPGTWPVSPLAPEPKTK